MDAIVSRLLADQHQKNHTVYTSDWKVLRRWVKSPVSISTMSIGEVEVKYLDVYSTGTLSGTNALVVKRLNTPLPQGTGVSERIGNHVQVKGVRLGILLYASSNPPSLVRVCVLRTPAIGTGATYPPLYTDIFKSAPDMPGTSPASIVLPRATETQKSTGQLLYDNTVTVSNLDHESSCRKLLVELDLDCKCLFKGPDEDDITTNGLALYLAYTSGPHASMDVHYYVVSRVSYTDS